MPSAMSRRTKLVMGVWIALAFSLPASAQFTGRTLGDAPVAGTFVGSLIVYLRTQDGQPLSDAAVPMIHVSSVEDFASFPNPPTRTGDGWMITGLPTGHLYQVQVSASGFLPASETVDLPQLEDASASVVIFMRPVDEALVFHSPTGKFVLAPNAQKEIQRALEDLQQNKISSAQKHAQKAVQLAPGNPYVEYVMGMTYLIAKQLDKAQPYLEKSVSIDPSQPVALGALGTLRYEKGDDAGAVEVLTRAVHLDPSSWKDEWFLACSYLRQKKFAESAEHAQKALRLGKDKARLAQIVLGEAQAELGHREEAIATFQTFAKENPSDPNTKDVLHLIELLRRAPPVQDALTGKSLRGPVGASELLAITLPLPPVEVPPRQNWAPPDVDADHPFVVSGASCPLPQILDVAGKKASAFVQDLQEFSAQEEFQVIQIKRSGELERPLTRTFSYLVFIDQIPPDRFDLREVRDDDVAAKSPGRLADSASALALAFHPVLQNGFEWNCEGLGQWHDKPAWLIHFRQRHDRPNVLASFDSGSGRYALPLKGRAWVSEPGGQVIHLDADLVNEIQPIDLKREHFSVDYKIVSFPAHKVDLWLPESVDTYIQYQGHFLHHYHHFTDFKLFWVGASQKIGAPKEAVSREP